MPPQCRAVVQPLLEALHRLIDFANILNAFEGEKAPLYFMVRSAEIQVSLLSLVLQLRLGCVKAHSDKEHPLFLEEDGRPLMHMHRVDKLWKVLKMYCTANIDLDRYLPLFVGDPRYPFPSKTALTRAILALHEKVYLLQIIEQRGFFNDDDQELLKKHLKNEGWRLPLAQQIVILKEKIVKDLAQQKKKTALAFDLAQQILTNF